MTTSNGTRSFVIMNPMNPLLLQQDHRITEQFGLQRTLKIIWVQPPAKDRDTFYQSRWLNVSSHLSLHLVRKSVYCSSLRSNTPFNYSFRYDGLRFAWLLWEKTLQFLICFCLHFAATISQNLDMCVLWRNPCVGISVIEYFGIFGLTCIDF